HGKCRVFGRDQRARHKQQDRPANSKNSEFVHTRIVSRCHSQTPNGGLYLDSERFCEIAPLLERRLAATAREELGRQGARFSASPGRCGYCCWPLAITAGI